MTRVRTFNIVGLSIVVMSFGLSSILASTDDEGRTTTGHGIAMHGDPKAGPEFIAGVFPREV